MEPLSQRFRPASGLERYPLTKETMFTIDQLVPWGCSCEVYEVVWFFWTAPIVNL